MNGLKTSSPITVDYGAARSVLRERRFADAVPLRPCSGDEIASLRKRLGEHNARLRGENPFWTMLPSGEQCIIFIGCDEKTRKRITGLVSQSGELSFLTCDDYDSARGVVLIGERLPGGFSVVEMQDQENRESAYRQLTDLFEEGFDKKQSHESFVKRMHSEGVEGKPLDVREAVAALHHALASLASASEVTLETIGDSLNRPLMDLCVSIGVNTDDADFPLLIRVERIVIDAPAYVRKGNPRSWQSLQDTAKSLLQLIDNYLSGSHHESPSPFCLPDARSLVARELAANDLVATLQQLLCLAQGALAFPDQRAKVSNFIRTIADSPYWNALADLLVHPPGVDLMGNESPAPIVTGLSEVSFGDQLRQLDRALNAGDEGSIRALYDLVMGALFRSCALDEGSFLPNASPPATLQLFRGVGTPDNLWEEYEQLVNSTARTGPQSEPFKGIELTFEGQQLKRELEIHGGTLLVAEWPDKKGTGKGFYLLLGPGSKWAEHKRLILEENGIVASPQDIYGPAGQER